MNHAAIPAILIMFMAACAAHCAVTPIWQPYDFEFRSDTRHDNPFFVPFEAEVTGPKGEKMVIPGFYDGNGVWKIRFSPTSKGDWTLRTSSTDSQLDGKSASIRSVGRKNPNNRGALKVDPAHPRHFIFEDGSRFFLMGYECDWLWALDMFNPKLPTINGFLSKLSNYGFNYMLLNVYAHDTNFRSGTTELRDYGPPPMFAWKGTNEEPVHDRLNLPFWQHYDRVMQTMLDHGFIAHIMITVTNKRVNWPERLSPEDDLYFRTVIARYGAFPNVVWDFSKESFKVRETDYKVKRVKFIHDTDPYNRLITLHDDMSAYESGVHGDRLDYLSDQNHRNLHETILKQREIKEWPVVNQEFGYEEPEDGRDWPYPKVIGAEEKIQRAWKIYMAGGYGAYYYVRTAWDIIHPNDNPRGYGYFKNLRDFFEGTRYWLMEPQSDLVSQGYCLANPGREYIVSQMEPGTFTLHIEGAGSALKAEWFNPLTGERKSAGRLRNGERTLTTPSGWEGMSVLHVR